MNWHLSRLCSAVLFGFLCVALVWWFCFWFLFFGLWWLRDSLLDFAQVLYQFTLEAPQFADGHACVNWLINSILQHAIERVGRPGGSHEGVGRKKNQANLVQTSNLWGRTMPAGVTGFFKGTFLRGNCRFPPLPKIEVWLGFVHMKTQQIEGVVMAWLQHRHVFKVCLEFVHIKTQHIESVRCLCVFLCVVCCPFLPLFVVVGFLFVWCFWSALPVVLLFLCAVPDVSLLRWLRIAEDRRPQHHTHTHHRDFLPPFVFLLEVGCFILCIDPISSLLIAHGRQDWSCYGSNSLNLQNAIVFPVC